MDISITPTIEQTLEQLRDLIRHCVLTPNLRTLCFRAVNHSLFALTPASPARTQSGHIGHHSYPGGLAAHTLEVAQIALATAEASCLEVNTEVLTTAAVLHDFMKIEEYVWTPEGSVQKTDYKQLVYHVAGSHAWFVGMCMEFERQGVGLPKPIQWQIEHTMLAHHGHLGVMPFEPQTVEAKILHYADMLSSRHGKAKGKPEEPHA